MTGTTNRTPTHQPQHPDSRRGIRAGRLSRDPMPAQSIMDDAGTGQRGVRCHRGTGWRPDCRPRCDRGYGCVLRVCSDAVNRPVSDEIQARDCAMSPDEIPCQRTGRHYTDRLKSMVANS